MQMYQIKHATCILSTVWHLSCYAFKNVALSEGKFSVKTIKQTMADMLIVSVRG